MPYTVAASFAKFLENITVGGDQSSTATSRRDSIVELLRNSFEILEAFPTGSLVRRTAHRRFADVDVILALHYGKHVKGKSPTQLLQDVQDALSDYNARIVKKNGQAVTLHFKTWPDVDIVPASRVADNNGNVTHYSIPDAGRGVWIATQPKTHDSQISGLTLEGRQLIRMVKAWNHSHSEYARSFHLETLALGGTVVTNDWPWEVYQYFERAAKSIDSPLHHPDGRNGRVDDYLDYYSRSELKKRFSAACDRSRDAWLIVYNKGDEEKAIRQYRIIFGDDFPAYG